MMMIIMMTTRNPKAVKQSRVAYGYLCHISVAPRVKVKVKVTWIFSSPSRETFKALRHGSHIHHTCLYLVRKRSPDGATTNYGSQTSICSILLIYRTRDDERLGWPGWLTYSGRFIHISCHPSAVGRAQDRESSPVKDQRSTAVSSRRNHKFHGEFLTEEEIYATPMVAAATQQSWRQTNEQTKERTDRCTALSRKAPALQRRLSNCRGILSINTQLKRQSKTTLRNGNLCRADVVSFFKPRAEIVNLVPDLVEFALSLPHSNTR